MHCYHVLFLLQNTRTTTFSTPDGMSFPSQRNYESSNCFKWEVCRTENIQYMYLLWFNFILGLNFILFCFKLIIIYYHTQKQKKMKFKPRIKLNHNIFIAWTKLCGTQMVKTNLVLLLFLLFSSPINYVVPQFRL